MQRTAALIGLLAVSGIAPALRGGAMSMVLSCTTDKVAAVPADPNARAPRVPSAAHAPADGTALSARVSEPAPAPAPPASETPSPLAPQPALVAHDAGAAPASAPLRAWHEVRAPLPGKPRAIGGYSAGCIVGAARLPTQGPGYLLMRPGRHRHFGHPQLVDFIRSLGAALVAHDLGALVIGDLGQPRGGPAPDGHASHQIGLDADLWYPLPATAEGIPAAPRARRALRALPVANFPRQRLTEHWNPRVPRVLQLAAADARVDRIFVNPMIKRALCRSETDRSWLRKLRPWWGHDAHFHVRLACPSDSPECRPQQALAPGDGCDTVDWWFSKEATAERDEERAKYRSKVGPGDLLPTECHAVLAAAD